MLIRNTGNAALVVASVESTGEPFYVGGPGSFSLSPGEQIGLNVFYLPSEPVTMSGAVVIRSNDPNDPETTVELYGSISQDDKPFLSVITERPEYHQSDTVWALYVLGNPGLAVPVDAYVAFQLPGDPNFYFFPSFMTSPMPVRLVLPEGLYIAPTTLLTLDLINPVAQGEYVVYSALCVPGTEFDFLSELFVARFSYE